LTGRPEDIMYPSLELHRFGALSPELTTNYNQNVVTK